MKKLIALLLAAGMALEVSGCGARNHAADTTPSTQATQSVVDDALYTKDSYTADAETALAAKDTVVAVIGDAELTNGTLQTCYWTTVYDFLNTYGYYAPYFGLDYSQPLDEQSCSEIDGTWQHYFLNGALQSWHNYQAMALMAKEAGLTLSDGLQAEMDALYESAATAVTEGGFDSLDAFIQSDMGPGCTYDDYRAYTEVYYLGYQYYSTTLNAYEITDEMISGYFTSHESELAESGITKDNGDVFSVRHILIEVAGSQTEADWEACLHEAQGLLDEWLAGAHTEDTFAEFAARRSADGGSSYNGGLYTGLDENTNFVQEFKDWYLDEHRQAGDYGLVKSAYGYHIMYYSGSEAQWSYVCRSSLQGEYSNAIIAAAAARFPMTVDYEKIVLGEVKLAVTE